MTMGVSGSGGRPRSGVVLRLFADTPPAPQQNGDSLCQNCAVRPADQLEISRLIYREGELFGTELVSLIALCDQCLTWMVERDWPALGRDAGGRSNAAP